MPAQLAYISLLRRLKQILWEQKAEGVNSEQFAVRPGVPER